MISHRTSPFATSAAICLNAAAASGDESMHPYYYTCPLSYLDLAPEQSADWRAGVRAYHARRRTPTASAASAAASMA